LGQTRISADRLPAIPLRDWARRPRHGVRAAEQRQITASIADDFKRRDRIRRQHLEDAFAAM
jgi:hypothetical protein